MYWASFTKFLAVSRRYLCINPLRHAGAEILELHGDAPGVPALSRRGAKASGEQIPAPTGKQFTATGIVAKAVRAGHEPRTGGLC